MQSAEILKVRTDHLIAQTLRQVAVLKRAQPACWKVQKDIADAEQKILMLCDFRRHLERVAGENVH